MSATQRPVLLIANRGEIALRVLRAARDEGWSTVAVYSDADRQAPHTLMADRAVLLGGAAPAESYLSIERLLEAARATGATHVHPGYGFLSENAAFARACEEAGLVFVGPTSEAIRQMGDKVTARELAGRAGVPLVPGTNGLPPDLDEAVAAARTIGYPVLVKAAYGGGGKGMRLCRDDGQLRAAVELARGEAARAFGNDLVYLEKAVVRPRHIEVQILCDHHGGAIHLGERECSIQRRHQKLIEESPSTAISEETRARMGEAAVQLARAISYRNAGTVEFLVGEGGEFYFLEMNTRLQVEHPVTEAVTGIDLVRAQLRIAQGEPLPWTQQEIRSHGWSIECRVCAEDPAQNFLPASGRILWARLPEGPGVRNDAAVESGLEVPVQYDPMLAKLIAWGDDREQARLRLLRALEEYTIEGIPTNLAFHRWALRHPAFIEGRLHTGFIEEHYRPEHLRAPGEEDTLARIAALSVFLDREGLGGYGPRSHGPSQGSAPGGGPVVDPWAPRISAWKRGAR